MVSRRIFLGTLGAAALAPGADADSIIDIHQHTNYSGRTDEQLIAHQHTMGIGVQSMVRRLPMMLGALGGGWLIRRFGWSQGIQYALCACILLGLTTMLFQWFMVEPERESISPAKLPAIGMAGARCLRTRAINHMEESRKIKFRG